MMLYIIPYLFYSALSFLGIIFQGQLFSYIEILGAKPDLLLIIAVLAGIKTGKENGAAAGAVVGLWADLLMGGFFGVHILVYAIIGYVFGLLALRLNLKSYIGYFFSILLGSFFAAILFILIFDLVGMKLSFWHSLGGIALPQTFYNCLLLLLSFPFIFLYRRFKGFKIGFVDMYGGGIILISKNQPVDMDLVKERKKSNKSHRTYQKRKEKEKLAEIKKKRRGKERHEDAYFDDDFDDEPQDMRFREKKQRPTFKRRNKSVKKKPPRR